MPIQNQAAFFQLSLLLLADLSNRLSLIKCLFFRTFTEISKFHKYFSLQSWKKFVIQVLGKRGKSLQKSTVVDDLGESPALEVLAYKNKDGKGYFAKSTTPRSPRSSKVKFRVGQVIKHKIWGYRGVIIGWDEDAKAPEWWVNQNHPDDKPDWRTQPNYSVIVDTRDRPTPQSTYIPQENIEVLKQTKIIHPVLDDYFENYDGTQYLIRPWLKALYPHD
ncbi:PREDICTED: F-box only protein 21-like [Priapulus caudatus]|uniref:F-box only protein 21-like n=1 Tax=Priapulus caudatus TaxID=37621 RepID=A0ABM1FAS6_PRICU|nr:PREDICTED: F-box only protein 21-like [Priapulus caudatus]